MTRKQALEFIESLKTIREAATDEQALQAKGIYPEWKVDVLYIVGERVIYNEQLYKVAQEHTSQADWTPDVVPTLFVAINETQAGSIEDPIPAVVGMQYVKDLYYSYNGDIYLCIRQDTDEGTVLYFTPDQLVGNYFEVVAA